jgi:acetylornithine aminotransferase
MIGFDVPAELKDARKVLLSEYKIFTGEAKPNVVRLLPALNLSKTHADEFVKALKGAMAKLSSVEKVQECNATDVS